MALIKFICIVLVASQIDVTTSVSSLASGLTCTSSSCRYQIVNLQRSGSDLETIVGQKGHMRSEQSFTADEAQKICLSFEYRLNSAKSDDTLMVYASFGDTKQGYRVYESSIGANPGRKYNKVIVFQLLMFVFITSGYSVSTSFSGLRFLHDKAPFKLLLVAESRSKPLQVTKFEVSDADFGTICPEGFSYSTN